MLKKYLIASIVGLSIASTAYAGVFDFLKPLLFDDQAAQEQSFGDTGTITRLDQWSATTSPVNAVTPRQFAKPVYLSGHIQFAETTTPATPGLNSGVLYVADDGSGGDGISALFFLDDAGTVTQLGSGGGGGGGCTNLNCLTDVVLSSVASSSVLTHNGSEWVNYLPNFNSIFGVASSTQGGTDQTSYATGDTLYASAPNTLTKATIGTNGQVWTSNGSIPTWSSDVAHLSGAAFTGPVSFADFPTVTGIATDADELVNVQTMSNFIQGAGLLKEAVRAATTVNGTLATAFENGTIIDGVTLATGDRILLKDQTDASENGIYVVAAIGAPSRAADYNEDSEVLRGTSVSVLEGTENTATLWVQTAEDPVVGTDDLVFQQLPPPTVYTASTGIQLVGTDFRLNLMTNSALYILANQLSVLVDNSTIATSSIGLIVKTGGITGTQLATGAVDLTSSDVTGTLPIANGGTNNTTATDDAVLVGNGTTFELKTLPSCNDVSGQHLNYNAASNTWSCGTSGGSGGGGGGSGDGELTYSESLDTSTTTVNVGNTAAETTIYETVIPAGRLNTGGIMRYILAGTYRNSSGAGRTFTVRVKFNGTTLNTRTTGTIGSNGATTAFEIDGYLVGGTTTASVLGQMQTTVNNGIDSLWSSLVDSDQISNSSTVDTGTTNTLEITLQHSAATTNLNAIKQVAQLSHINATTSVSSALTPWNENIDGAGYDLANVGDITAVTFQATGTTASNFPYASTTALTSISNFFTNLLMTGSTTLQNFTGANSTTTNSTSTASFFTPNLRSTNSYSDTNTVGTLSISGLGQGWLHTAGPGNNLTASTGPTVAYITSTSTATSTFYGNIASGGATGFRLWANTPGATWASGSVTIGGSVPNNGFSVTRVGGSDSTFARFRTADTTGAFAQFSAATGIQFNFRDSGSNSRAMIDTNGATYFAPAAGDIGLGTISPLARVHIATSTASASSTAKFTNGSTGALITDGFEVGIGADNNPWIWSMEASPMRIGTNNLEAIRITSGLGVGISTTSPSSLLSVAGDIYSTGGLGLGGTVAQSSNTIYFGNGGGVIGPYLSRDSSSGGLVVDSYGGANGDFLVKSNATNLAIFKTGGNVGIGTTTPNWKLQVAGTRPFFALSDTAGGTNGKHWTISSQGGRLYFATSSDLLATSSQTALTLGMTGSNVSAGIGSTTPVTEFGVTGDGWFSGDLYLMGADINTGRSSGTNGYPTSIGIGRANSTGAGGSAGTFAAGNGGNGGGSSTGKTGGAGGNITLGLGADGAGTSGSDTNNGGAGGSLTAANGGIGGEVSDGGAGGAVSLGNGGAGGSGGGTTGGNAGNTTLSAGGDGDTDGNDGTVTIGRTGGLENALLQVNGTLNLQQAPASGAGDVYICLDSTGEIQSGALCAASTEKVKENIKPFSGKEALAIILKLDAMGFNYDPNYYNGKEDINYIAEQVFKIDPRLVILAEKDETLLNGKEIKIGDPIAINTNAMLAVTGAAVKELAENGVSGTAKTDYLPYGLIGLQFVLFIGYVLYRRKTLKANNFSC